MLHLKIERLTDTATIPSKGHASDLGWDLYASEACTIAPGKLARLQTGVAVEFPPETGGFIKDRSSLASKGLHTLAGVIDTDYRGEIMIMTVNLSDQPITIDIGDRCAQMVLVTTLRSDAVEVDSLASTKRGAGGFGSTGT